MKTLVAVLFCAALSFAQTPTPPKSEPKTVAPLTEKEKLSVLTPQKVLFQKYSNYLQLQTQLAQAQTDTQNASQEVAKAWQALYDSRKLGQDDALRCDGPSPGPCAKVAAGDIDLVAKPAK